MEVTQCKKTIFSVYLPLLVSILFILLLLTDPVTSSSLVISGLTTWCKKMIPSLFPFMVLSGFLLRTGLSYRLSRILYPFLGTLFQLSPDCIYIIFTGFLCGFPMGANIIAESLTLKRITQREADLLLSFCNNIGPVYFISFVSVLCPFYPLWLTLSIMYLVPVCYGLVLRYTRYRKIPLYKKICSNNTLNAPIYHYSSTNKTSSNTPRCAPVSVKNASYGRALQDSLQKAISSILYLGGYMVIFTTLQLPFYNTYYQLPEPYIHVLKGLLEISSGITALQPYPDLYGIVYSLFLPFCGLCCLYQTYAMIQTTPLSLASYFKHKLAQTLCAIIIYGLVKMVW